LGSSIGFNRTGWIRLDANLVATRGSSSPWRADGRRLQVVASTAVILFGRREDMPVCWGIAAGVAASLFLYWWPASSYEPKDRKGRFKAPVQAAPSKLT
jgi:hypothetical protein